MRSERVIVALDVENLKKARRLVSELAGLIRIFKIGSELFTACGPAVIDLIHRKKAEVFLDLKFHDIPATVDSASAAATKLGVFMMSVHAGGGGQMMRSAAESIRKTAADKKIPAPKLLGVTVLTSMADSDLREVGILSDVNRQVENLTRLTKASGLDGVVASPWEIELIRKTAGKDFLIVTPGVRPSWAVAGDQKRVLTPHEAFKKGADFIVVGRPITRHARPLEAAHRILEEIR